MQRWLGCRLMTPGRRPGVGWETVVEITYPPMYRFRSPGTLSIRAITAGVGISENGLTPEMRRWGSTMYLEEARVGEGASRGPFFTEVCYRVPTKIAEHGQVKLWWLRILRSTGLVSQDQVITVVQPQAGLGGICSVFEFTCGCCRCHCRRNRVQYMINDRTSSAARQTVKHGTSARSR